MSDKTPNIQYTPTQHRALELLSAEAKKVLLFGGSRSGKTFVLVVAMLVRALKEPGSRHAILRYRFNSLKTSIGMDTLPKVLKMRFPELTCEIKDHSFIRLPNGSEIWLLGLDDAERAERVLGKEFATIYFNECSELDYSSVQIALTRLAQKTNLVNKAYFDCNPPSKSHWIYRLFVNKIDPISRVKIQNPNNYAMMKINPLDNAINLAPNYLDNLRSLSQRKQERFLFGNFIDNAEGALWTQEMIDRARVVTPPDMVRIVIGVDPAVSNEESSDLTGIVAAGYGVDGRFYVLDDCSLRASPLAWAREAINLYHKYNADRIIGEVNNGGDLIEQLLRSVDPDIAYKSVRASRGKILRAEPIAALYEQGKVSHVGAFSDLEDEMISFSPLLCAKSPDRMDALVWALSELRTEGVRFFLA